MSQAVFGIVDAKLGHSQREITIISLSGKKVIFGKCRVNNRLTLRLPPSAEKIFYFKSLFFERLRRSKNSDLKYLFLAAQPQQLC
jgi:hypothetical protein